MNRQEILQKLPALLLPWYDVNKRDLPWRKNTDAYRVWVSEIMLQQTRVEAVKEHYERFMRELPTVQALAACTEEKLLKLWEGLGYYSRARNLHSAAKEIAALGEFPSDHEKIRKLKGVGAYTAGAIASIAFEQPTPAVDGNVIRVLSRLLADERGQDVLKDVFEKELAPAYPPARRGDFTQSLMELGATICLPSSPRCMLCPLFSFCGTRGDALPVKKRKAERKKTEMTVFVFSGENGAGLFKRTDGVLKGLWQFYNVTRFLGADEARGHLLSLGLKEFSLSPAPVSHKHVFTHLEWDMRAYAVQTEEVLPFLTYFPKSEIVEKISVPSAFQWCIELI